jgi:dihydrolipoamide dehydrogenase
LKFPFQSIRTCKSYGDLDGFVKIIADAKQMRFLSSYELVVLIFAEAVVSMEFKASAEDISRMSHAHPTFAEGSKKLP